MMGWLAENWLWIILAIVFVGIHFFGHGKHGGGGHKNNKKAKSSDSEKPNP